MKWAGLQGVVRGVCDDQLSRLHRSWQAHHLQSRAVRAARCASRENMAAEILNGSAHVDPDAQATVTDFIDYTEHLPSDIRRSLALIEKLNDLIYDSHDKIHALSQKWSAGVDAREGSSVESASNELREQISYQKELSRKYVWASLAEAKRLDQEISRHQNLLKITEIKLDALPLPPSRDPSPKPISPQVSRAGDSTVGPKIKLRLDKARAGVGASSHRPKLRRMVIVPGEVLPPPNPHSPTSDTKSDSDSPSPEPSPPRPGRKTLKITKPLRVDDAEKPAKPRKERQAREQERTGPSIDSPSASNSNANALLTLTPPPIDPVPGSRWAPWTRLTEWEMARLRKRMKKNSVWTPSDTMIRRELHDAGRGPENYVKAKQKAEDTGEDLIDCDNLASRRPGDDVRPGEIALGSKLRLTNKGMSLNVQKKHKKLLLAKELALEQAREAMKELKSSKSSKGRSLNEADRAKEAARIRAETVESQLSLLGSQFRDLFTRPGEDMPEKDRIVLKTPGRKRRREQDRTEESQLHSQLHSEIVVTSSPNAAGQQPPKRRKLEVSLQDADQYGLTRNSTTIKVPLAAAAPSPLRSASNTRSSMNSKPEPGRRLSLVIKPPAPPSRTSSRTTTPVLERPPSRQSPRLFFGQQASLESARDRPRRQSNTPATPATVTLMNPARSKRPAPGPVTNAAGGNAISVGKRAKRPSKKTGGARWAASAQPDAADEDDVDPNEPRYCLCDDVSWGTMVACENIEVSSSTLGWRQFADF